MVSAHNAKPEAQSIQMWFICAWWHRRSAVPRVFESLSNQTIQITVKYGPFSNDAHYAGYILVVPY